MKKDFETILDESLSRLEQKESIEACLRRYPQHAAQLEPLLRTALKVEGLKDTEPPSAQAMAAGRERFLREAARLRAERAPAHRLAKGPVKRRRFMLSMAAALLIALLLALAALAGSEAPDPLRQLYHWWGTLVPQPTMTRPATDTPWPTMTPHEDQTPTATRTLYPAESGRPTFTFTPESSHTPEEKAAPISKPTDTLLPTITPVPPTNTPAPTATPVPPNHTPYPTEDHGGGQGDRDQGNDDDRGGNHDSEGRDDDGPGGGGQDSGDHGDSGQDSGDHDGSDGGGGQDGGHRGDGS